MLQGFLQENEIVVSANAVKYHDIGYHDNYIVVTQNRTRRRIYNGWYFEDTGSHVYISTFYSHLFQHKRKTRQFIVNTISKEWKEFQSVIVEKHIPERIGITEVLKIKELEK